MENCITKQLKGVIDNYDVIFPNAVNIRVKAGDAGQMFKIKASANNTLKSYGQTKFSGDVTTMPVSANTTTSVAGNGGDGCVIVDNPRAITSLYELGNNVSVDFYQLKDFSLSSIDSSNGFYGDINYLVSGGGKLQNYKTLDFRNSGNKVYGEVTTYLEKLLSNGANDTYGIRPSLETRITLNGEILEERIWAIINSSDSTISVYTNYDETNVIASYANGAWTFV